MSRCTGCGYMYADCDENGTPIGFEHCHFEGPDGWAPCEQDDLVCDDEEDCREYMMDYSYNNYNSDWIF